MSQQSNAAPASVTKLTPEPAAPEFSKSGIPLHMMDPLTLEEEISSEDMPDNDEPQSLEEALMS